jgi:hypothetical protein
MKECCKQESSAASEAHARRAVVCVARDARQSKKQLTAAGQAIEKRRTCTLNVLSNSQTQY